MDSIWIFTLLAGISAIHLVAGQYYNITKYDSGSGLYYEQVGVASIYIHDFNIITYYDLDKYFLNRVTVLRHTDEVKKLCETNSNQDCPNYLRLLDETLENLDHKHKLITDIVEEPAVPTRKKRFWTEVLTTAVKGVFGIIRNRQKTNAVNEEIQKYRNEVEHLKTMLTHQMYIYENMQNEVNTKLDKLSTDITQLSADLRKLTTRITNAERDRKITNLILYTNNVISLFITEQSDLLDCLILARQGVLHPIILSPNMLREKLLKAKREVVNNNILADALQTAADNYNVMFNMIKPVIYIQNYTMIFDFDLPLVTDSSFDIYKLTSAPVSMSKNIYAYIYPESPYLFHEKKHDRYFFMDVYEFEKCKDAGDRQYVCKREKPLRSKELTCEHMLILSGEAMPENCDVRLIKIDETLFIELEREGSWLFTAPKSDDITFHCDYILQRTNIEGTGVVDVETKCFNTVSGPITLRDFSTNNLNISHHFEIHKPRGNLKKYLENVDLTHLKATMNVRVLSRAETVKLKDFGMPLSSIQMRNELYTDVSAKAHNGLLYVVCILCCALLVFNVYIYRSLKKSQYDVSKHGPK